MMQFFRSVLRHPLLAGLSCLLVIVVFHSPRWWIIIHEAPGTFEWDRALSYLKQCEAPFCADIEPALRWRFVPQVFAFLLGLNRPCCLIIPWLGAWALLAFIYHQAKTKGVSAVESIYVTLVVGASAPVLVSTGWLGVNDSWVALGLCYLAFGRRRSLLVAACLLCPFIDERFVFGVPYAIMLRLMAEAPGTASRIYARRAVQVNFGANAICSSKVSRIRLRGHTQSDVAFFASNISASKTYLWMAPLGAWMALRFAYYPMARQIVEQYRQQRFRTVTLILLAVAPVMAGFVLASDTMRTAGILVPLALWCAIKAANRKHSVPWFWLAAASLLVPAAHVSFTKVVVINSLPVELWRILR